MSLRIVSRQAGCDRDWELQVDDTATLADVATAVGLDPTTGTLLVNGRPLAHATVVGDAALGNGAVLELTAGRRPNAPALPRLGALPDGEGTVDLHQVAGLAAGRTVPLPAGRYDVGGAMAGGTGLHAGPVHERAAELAVTDGGARLRVGTDARILVDGHPVAAGDRTLAHGSLVHVAGLAFRLAPHRSRAGRRVLPDERGMATVHRPPRAPRPAAEAPPAPPARPADPRQPGALSWATLLGPVPIVVAMALLMSPRFALLGVAGPVLALGRWWEGKRRHRRDRRRQREAIDQLRAAFALDLLDAATAERQRRARAHPDPVVVRDAVAGAGMRLWERRQADDDALVLDVGLGAVHWLPAGAAGPAGRFPELAPEVSGYARLTDVPAVVPLGQRRAIGLVGTPAATAAVARWLVVQAATWHGPADLTLAAVVGRGPSRERWSWLKWLPHLVDRAASHRVASSVDEVTALAGALADELPPMSRSALGTPTSGPRRWGLVLVTDPALARVAGLRELMGRVGSTVRAVVTAATVDQLPAWCDVVLEIDADGCATLADHGTDEPVHDLLCTGIDTATATEIARGLSLYDDPETTSRTALPEHVNLVSLLGLDDAIDDPDALCGQLVRRWQQADASGLAATVGATEHGPLVLDLVHDGPHGLVAGTTGSGKSELLRSLVASLAATTSPDDVNLVLIDFKGGGAFDACADLPHTVAVVTDLDAHLGARALRCLRAEVRYREGLLRAAGASDLGTYVAGRPAEPLPRLLVVIDEFATLAAELPEFLTSIVDIAQRGRSLGIHLLLATQRPSGVIDNKVRANTNLRVALRVQDDGDSLDVVGCTDAARLSRRTPGRALARFGSGDITAFQAALVTAAPDRTRHRPLVAATAFALAGDARADDASPVVGARTGGPVRTDRPTDLERLAGAARAAARDLGCRPPRIPWPAPLPTQLDAIDLWAGGAGPEPWTVTVGLADEPDEQRQMPWRWRAVNGNLAVFGANPLDTAQALTTVALGLATSHRADEAHLYVVDGGTGALAPLADLPHCGAVIGGGDTTRVARLLEMLGGELDRRRALVRQHRLSGVGPDTVVDGQRLALVTLVVENAGAVLDALDGDGERDAPGRFVQLVRDGAALGMATVLSVPHERSLPSRVTGLIGNRVVLKMSDTVSYLALGLSPRDLPALEGLRAVVSGGLEVQIAAVGSVAALVRSTTAQQRVSAGGPAPVRTLGARIGLGELGGGCGHVDDERWRLVVGATPSLTPVTLDLPAGIHAVVSGPAGSGKSTALVTLAHAALAASGGDIALVTVTARRSPLERLGLGARRVTDADGLADALAAAGDDRCLVLVDDAELLAEPLARALAGLADSRSDQVRVIAAGRTDQLRSLQSWTAPLRQGRTGIALQPSATDGDLFKTSLPVRASMVFGAGRGYVVQLGTPTLAQVALAD